MNGSSMGHPHAQNALSRSWGRPHSLRCWALQRVVAVARLFGFLDERTGQCLDARGRAEGAYTRGGRCSALERIAVRSGRDSVVPCVYAWACPGAGPPRIPGFPRALRRPSAWRKARFVPKPAPLGVASHWSTENEDARPSAGRSRPADTLSTPATTLPPTASEVSRGNGLRLRMRHGSDWSGSAAPTSAPRLGGSSQGKDAAQSRAERPR